jgi:hypothetical protein
MERWIAPILYAVLVLAFFFDPLFMFEGRVLSSADTDLALQFLAWREFGFSEIARGNLPLWNPYVYGGTYYFAGFQSALLYPPNWLHLALPLHVAINWIIALHVFAAGYFTYLFVRGRGVSVFGATLSGLMFMFAPPYFYHIFSGHLPHLSVMVWIPIVFLAIDKLSSTGSWKWILLGALAVALQILAGHPQYVYYTAMAAGVYCLVRIYDTKRENLLWLLLGFVGMYVGGALLSAAQLFAGLQATSEMVRAGGTDRAFASTFSLPPINFLTMLAPHFFGKFTVTGVDSASYELAQGARVPSDLYWSFGYLWELSTFVSITGLALAVFAIVTTSFQQTRPILILLVVCIALALGRWIAPLYDALFDFLPMYGSFRGTVKFFDIATVFIALLAGMGFDTVRRLAGRAYRGWLIAPVTIAAIGIALAFAGTWIGSSSASGPQGAWGQFVQWVGGRAIDDKEAFLINNREVYANPAFIRATAQGASAACLGGAVTLLAVAFVFVATRYHRLAVHLFLVVATIELLRVASAATFTMDPAAVDRFPKKWTDAIEAMRKTEPDARVYCLDMGMMNDGMVRRYHGLWGYDPGVLKRFAELAAATHNKNANTGRPYEPLAPGQYVAFDASRGQVLQMLRVRHILVPNREQQLVSVPDPFPVAMLMQRYVVVEPSSAPRRDVKLAIQQTIWQGQLNFRQTVLLEAKPEFEPRQWPPDTNPPGKVEARFISTDEVELKADVPVDSLVLVTNPYSSGWRVRRVQSSVSQTYTIQPANWALQAIPLRAGTHHLILEYLPTAFRVGLWTSTLSVIAYGFLLYLAWRSGRIRTAPASEANWQSFDSYRAS